jgi:hypothetical protein
MASDSKKQDRDEPKKQLSEKELEQMAGGRREITKDEWERLAATKDFYK